MRRTAVLLLTLLVTPAAAAEGPDIPALRGLVASGRCNDAMTRVESLSRKERRLPDVRVLEANCLLNEGRTIERVYLKERYQRALIGRGGTRLPAARTESFYTTRVSFESKARKKAIALFRDALQSAPERQDIVVGTVAALANAEAEAEAAELLTSHEGRLDAPSARDLARLVEDKLRLRDEDGARVLAEALVARLGSFPVSWLARLRVALVDRDTDGALACVGKMKPLPEGGNDALKQLARRLVLERRWKELVPLSLDLGRSETGALILFALARDRVAFGSGEPAWRDIDRRLGPNRDPKAPVTTVVAHYLQIHRDGLEPDAELHLAASRFLAGRSALEAAIAEVDGSLQKDPENSDAWLHLARLLRAQFEFELALDASV